jgi:DNA-binding FadR family transcriptional regulator
MFREVVTTRASSDIVDQIKEAILSGELESGNRLPSQRELQKVFKVSRPVVTESLRMLEKMGLIQIRPGVNGGSFVANATQTRLSELVQLSVQLQEIGIRELVEFREHMESANAAWAAERRTDEDIERLRAILDTMGKLIHENGPWAAIIEQDSLFHFHLAEVAKNRLSLTFLKVIWNSLLAWGKFHVLSPRAGEIHASLVQLFDAIVQKQSQRAYQIMFAHIQQFNDDLLEAAKWKRPRRVRQKRKPV